MAVVKKTSKVANANSEKLTIVERLGSVMLNAISPKTNTNGKEYIATPFGAVYGKIAELKTGLYQAVKLSNGMIALNTPTSEEKMEFLAEQKAKYPDFSLAEIKAELGI